MQNTTNPVRLASLADEAAGTDGIHNRELDSKEQWPGAEVAITPHAGEGLVILPGLALSDGSIHCQIRGRDEAHKSFVGLAFGLADERHYEVVWLRPFNFRADDAERYRHAVQYASFPDHNWHRLREDLPDVFEAALREDLDPESWIDVRIDIRSESVSVWLGRMDAPTLAVQRIRPNRGDGIGLWVGNGSGGAWRNLVIEPHSS